MVTCAAWRDTRSTMYTIPSQRSAPRPCPVDEACPAWLHAQQRCSAALLRLDELAIEEMAALATSLGAPCRPRSGSDHAEAVAAEVGGSVLPPSINRAGRPGRAHMQGPPSHLDRKARVSLTVDAGQPPLRGVNLPERLAGGCMPAMRLKARVTSCSATSRPLPRSAPRCNRVLAGARRRRRRSQPVRRAPAARHELRSQGVVKRLARVETRRRRGHRGLVEPRGRAPRRPPAGERRRRCRRRGG
jgi:hypothetical protein